MDRGVDLTDPSISEKNGLAKTCDLASVKFRLFSSSESRSFRLLEPVLFEGRCSIAR